MGKEYFVFISYKSEDVEWAIWLQHELEHYHLPASFNGRTDIKHDLRPVFRDIDELSAGNLPEQIESALLNSNNLIVICSPKAASSAWVNQEVNSFIMQGKTNKIFPFIVEGTSPSEYFPEALLNLPKREERLGGDVTRNGRDIAFIKVVSGMLGVGFDALWNRYEREKAEEERKQREQRDNLLRAQSRLIAEKAKIVSNNDSHTALKLIQAVLPKDLSAPNRPYTPEAESILRYILNHPNYVFTGHEEAVDDIAISPDNKRLVSVSHDNTIRLWDILSGANLWVKDACCADGKVAYSADGKLIASSSWDGSVNIWNPDDGQLINSFRFENYEGMIYCLDFLSDNRLLIVDSDNQVTLLNVIIGEIERVTIKIDSPLDTATLSRDGRYIAIGFRDKKDRHYTDVYEMDFHSSFITNKEKLLLKRISRIPLDGAACSLSFDSESRKIAIGLQFNKTVYLYDFGDNVGKPQSVMLHNDDVDDVCVSSDQIIHVASGNSIFSWNRLGQCIMRREGHTEQINKILISRSNGNIFTASWDGTIRMWDSMNSSNLNLKNADNLQLESDKQLLTINSGSVFDPGCYGQRNYMFSHDRSVRVLKNGGSIVIKDGTSGELIAQISDNDNIILAADISYDNNLIATSLSDNSICVWDISSGKRVHVLKGHESSVNSVAFNHDNNMLVSASEDETIRIWNLQTETEIKKLSVYHTEEYRINHDRRFHSLYIGEGCEPFAAQAAVFSLDDQYILSGYGDGVLRIWKIEEEYCVEEIYAHDDEILNVYISIDGTKIITESSDKTTRIWAFNSLKELIDELWVRFAGCPLNVEERRHYYLD